MGLNHSHNPFYVLILLRGYLPYNSDPPFAPNLLSISLILLSFLVTGGATFPRSKSSGLWAVDWGFGVWLEGAVTFTFASFF